MTPETIPVFRAGKFTIRTCKFGNDMWEWEGKITGLTVAEAQPFFDALATIQTLEIRDHCDSLSGPFRVRSLVIDESDADGRPVIYSVEISGNGALQEPGATPEGYDGPVCRICERPATNSARDVKWHRDKDGMIIHEPTEIVRHGCDYHPAESRKRLNWRKAFLPVDTNQETHHEGGP